MKLPLRFPSLFSAFRSVAAFRDGAFDMNNGPTTYWDGRLRFERRPLGSAAPTEGLAPRLAKRRRSRRNG